MPTITKLFSAEETAQHNSREDCWIVVDGKVYDVSSYLDDHPGGDDIILETAGKDATEGFEDAGHGKEARELLETFCIGEVDTSSPSIPELETSSKDQDTCYYCKKLMDSPKQYWAVTVAVVGVSMVVGFLYLRKK